MEKKIGSQFDLLSVLRDLLRNWWCILLLAVGASLLANVYVDVTYRPQYKTKTTFAVTTRGSSSSVYNNLNSAKDLAERFTQVLDSNLMQKAVVEDLGLSSFDAQTTAYQIPETNLVELTVTADSAMESYQVLESILNNYSTLSDYLVGNVILEIVQDPVVPTGVSNPKNVRTPMKRAFVLMAALVILLISWMSYCRDTVKNEGQFSSKVDAERLGTIFHERKADIAVTGPFSWLLSLFRRKNKGQKVSMLITNPMRSFFFTESNRMTASRIRSRMDREQAKVVMITSVMENEGKSTVAANVALGIAQEGKRVLLIDTDFRKPSQYKIFQLKKEDTVNLTGYLLGSEKPDHLRTRYENTSLYLIANSKSTRQTANIADSGRLEALIGHYREQVDYIILDTAPMALVSDTEAMTRLADSAVLVVREDTVPARGINDALDTLERTGCKILGCVYSNAYRRNLQKGGYGGYKSYYGGYYGKSEK